MANDDRWGKYGQSSTENDADDPQEGSRWEKYAAPSDPEPIGEYPSVMLNASIADDKRPFRPEMGPEDAALLDRSIRTSKSPGGVPTGEPRPEKGFLDTQADVATQFVSSAAERTLPTLKGLVNVAERAGRSIEPYNPASGMADRTVRRVTGAPTLGRALEQQHMRVREAMPEPETGAGGVSRILSPFALEGLKYMAGGGAIRKGLGMAERTAGPVGEALKDALAVAPIDIATTAAGPEESMAGVGAMMATEFEDEIEKTKVGQALNWVAQRFGNENIGEGLQRIADDPVLRASFEIATGLGADAVLRLTGAGVRGTGRAVERAGQTLGETLVGDIGGRVAEGFTEGARAMQDARPREGPVEAPWNFQRPDPTQVRNLEPRPEPAGLLPPAPGPRPRGVERPTGELPTAVEAAQRRANVLRGPGREPRPVESPIIDPSTRRPYRARPEPVELEVVGPGPRPRNIEVRRREALGPRRLPRAGEAGGGPQFLPGGGVRQPGGPPETYKAPEYREGEATLGESLAGVEPEPRPRPEQAEADVDAATQRRRRLADIIDPSRREELAEAYRDPMTGLPNQTAFERARTRLDADPDVEITAVDAINLKAANDLEGREAGDQFLARIGQALRAEAEAQGIDPRNVFRAGGDEFAIAGPRGRTQSVAEAAAERVSRQIGDSDYSTGIRYGTGDTWLDADAAAQAAKAGEIGPRFRESTTTRTTDLFGEERVSGPEQMGFDVEPPRNVDESASDARTTVSALQGKVRRGDATPDEIDRYTEALSFLRREEGLDAEEVGLRAAGEEVDERTGSLFDEATSEEPDVEELAPFGEPPRTRGGERTRQAARKQYELLDEDQLIARRNKLIRGLGRRETAAEAVQDKSVKVVENTWGERFAVGTGVGENARGGLTQSEARLDVIDEILRERGVDPTELDPMDAFRGVGRSDVAGEYSVRGIGTLNNKDLVGVGGQRIQNMSDDEIVEEIRRILPAIESEAGRGHSDLTERLAILTAEAERPGRNIPNDVLGGARQEVVSAIARTGAGALAGAATGATLDEENRARGALIGAAVGAGTGAVAPRATKTIKEALEGGSRHLTDLEARYLSDPDVRTVVESVSDGSVKSDVPEPSNYREMIGRAFQWLRYKGAREVAPMEYLEKGVTQGEETALRNALAQVRGAVQSAQVHMEETLKPVLEAAQEAPTLVNALAKAERGMELAQLGKEVSDEQLQAWARTIEELSNIPEVRNAVDQIRAYYRSLLDMKRDAGLISDDQYQAIVESGEYYIPFLPEDIAAGQRVGGAAGGRYNPNRSSGVRRMSDELNEAVTVDPLDQAVVDTYETFHRVRRQRVANVMSDLVERFPEEAAPFIREVPSDRVSRNPVTGQLSVDSGRSDGRIIESIVDGERKFYEIVDEDLYQSWANFDRRIQSTFLKAANASRTFMQNMVTGNPVFSIVNFMRDLMVSGVQYPLAGGLGRAGAITAAGAGVGAATAEEGERLRGGALGAATAASLVGGVHITTHLGRTVAAMNDILGPDLLGAVAGGTAGYLTGDEEDSALMRTLMGAGIGYGAGRTARGLGFGGNREIYNEFLREGGGGFGFYARNMEDVIRFRQKLINDGVSPSDFVNPRKWWDAVQYVSRAVETAPRLAWYKSQRKQGVDIGDAIFGGRDLSLDFSVKPGSQFLKGATQTIPFGNPAIQGMDKVVRLLADPNTSAVAGATIVAPTVALWAYNNRNPEAARNYQSRPLYERNIYWLIPKEDGGFVRVPKPFEVGFIYSSVPERMMDAALMEDPEQLQFALKDMWGQYGPSGAIGLPMPVAPAVEANMGEHGWDPFRRRTVNPYPWNNIPAEMQYDERTSTVALKLGQLTGWSPAKIDYVIRGHTGTLGSEFLDMVSSVARSTGIDDRPESASASRAFTRRFHTNPTSITEPELTFRRKWQEAEAAHNGLRRLLDEGKAEQALEFQRDNQEELAAYDRMKDVNNYLGDTWDLRNAIFENEQLSQTQKQEALARINDQVSEFLITVNTGRPIQNLSESGGESQSNGGSRWSKYAEPETVP